MDIYVSLRLQDDSWSVPVNLGSGINSSAADWKPLVSPDGRYLFFSSYRSIEAEDVIGKPYKNLMETYESPLNGYGTLFWVDATIVGKAEPEPQTDERSHSSQRRLSAGPATGSRAAVA